MADRDLRALAEAAGIAVRWRDAHDRDQQVPEDTLRAVLAGLGLPAGSARAARDSLAALRAEAARPGLPPLLTAVAGRPVAVPLRLDAPVRYRLEEEGGAVREGVAEAVPEGGCVLPPVAAPGYHILIVGGFQTVLAVAPERCFGPLDAGLPGGRGAGLAVQIYALRRDGDGGLGDFTALARLARDMAGRGLTGMAVSPLHALFSADPSRFSPYAPSSRLFLNVLHIDVQALLGELGLGGEAVPALEAAALVDWPAVARHRLALLRRAYDTFQARGGAAAAEFARYRGARGRALEDHATFEALHERLFAADPACRDWRAWPAPLRDPRGAAVADFAAREARAVAFHAFLQWQAERGLAGAQRAAREAGMALGLIGDLAIGVDPAGSQAWSRQDELMQGLSIGAPPDLFNPLGQDWGLAAAAPRALTGGGYRSFLEILRVAMQHGGGVRLDHILGLARLWVAPRGAPPGAGAYLRFPLDELLRLTALESWRHRSVVIGEDLGTVPEGLRTALSRAAVLGIRVLWFEREGDRFLPPGAWPRDVLATTTTHDLPTVAGWWAGRDIDWRARLGLLGPGTRRETLEAERARDRVLLWRALAAAGLAHGPPPPPQAGAAVAEAAAAFIGATPAALAFLPLEDALALEEQPNLPGTTDQHPNWRRRLPLPVDRLAGDEGVGRRIAALVRARRAA